MMNLSACSGGTGRRKKSVARVNLFLGSGNIKINGLELNEYLKSRILQMMVKQPLEIFDVLTKFDVVCSVSGGGLSGQAGAIRHGIARALNFLDEEKYHHDLKIHGFLTRDPRMKERKKYGLKAARKRPQFSKR